MRQQVQRGQIRKVLAAAVLASVAGGLVGCTGKGEANGFLDPTAVGRFDPNRPLVVPILSHLDVGLEESNVEFQSATEVRPEDLTVNAQDYAINPNDLVTVTIGDLAGPGTPDQVVTRRVSESGRISLPLIGQVPAAGRTEAELEREVAAIYKNQGLITNAQVAVTVTEARGRTFTLIGAGTQHAGVYPMFKADFRVTDALAAAGGEMPFSDVLYIVRDPSRRHGATTAPSSTGDATGTGTAPGGTNSTENPAAALEPSNTTPSGATPGVQPATGPAAKPPKSPPPPAPPASQPAAGANAGEGRIVIIDGKPVLIEGGQTQPAPAAQQPSQPSQPQNQSAEGAAQATAPAATAPTSPEMQPQTSDEPFAFNRTSAGGEQRIIRVSLRALRQGDLKQNVVIKPGDTLILPGPVLGEYYMEGHVARPGVFALNGRDITLTQAIGSAGMFDQIAIPRRTEIRRRLGPDREVVISVDLDAVYAGTQPNVYIRPNDEINVGTNAWAPFLAATRGAFRLTYGFGFLYDRNYASRANNAGLNGR